MRISTDFFFFQEQPNHLLCVWRAGDRRTWWGPGDSLFMDFYCIASTEENSPWVTSGKGHLCCLEQLPSDICGETVFFLSFHRNVVTASLLCFTSSWKLRSSGIILLVFLHVVYLSTWEYKPCEYSTVQAYVLRAMQGISQVDSKYFLNELMPSDALVLMCRNAPYSPPSRWEEDMWTCTLSLRSI